MIKYLIFDRGDTVIKDLPESYGGMGQWPYYQAVEGAIEILNRIYKKYYCVMASNTHVSTKEVIKDVLGKLKIENCIKEVFTQKELGCAKPALEFYLKIINILNADPEETCIIGNDYELDIVSAKMIGAKTILLSGKSNGFSCADIVISKFIELPKALSALQKNESEEEIRVCQDFLKI